MIKIVTIDLDGTLFNDQKVITEKNKEIIKKCHELGVRIVICTGRPTSGVLPVLEKLGLTTINDYAIIYNGAKIINAKTKEEIFSTTIDGKVVKELYLESKRLNTFIHAFRKNEELICNKYNPYTEIEARLNNLYAEVIDFDSISDDELFLKCMLIDNPDSVTNAMKNVKPKYYEEYQMVRSSQIFLEFLNKASSKGEGLKHLAKYLNIDIKDTMAIGDANNDIAMIKAAGVGCVMCNGFDDVKEYATYITKNDNNNSGVAECLEKFILDEIK